MRIHVSVLGTFQGMVVLITRVEVIIKTPRKRRADTGDSFEVSGAGSQDALQPSEMAQQGSAFRRSQARHRLQYRFVVAARPPAAVPADGKPMRFIADALDEPRGGRMRLEREWQVRAEHEESLLSGPAFGALGDPDQRDILETQGREHRVHLIDLAQAAVDEQ